MIRIDRPRPRIGAAALGIALFGLAFAFPAIGTCSRNPVGKIDWFDNQTAFLFGWLALFLFQIGWFANLAFVAHLVALLRGRRPSLWLLLVHGALLLIGVLTLLPALGMELPHNEAWSEPVCRLGPGFWLWVAAQSVVLASAALLRHSASRPQGSEA